MKHNPEELISTWKFSLMFTGDGRKIRPGWKTREPIHAEAVEAYFEMLAAMEAVMNKYSHVIERVK
jgi:hypothetical protein